MKLDLALRAHNFLAGLPPKQFRQVAVRLLGLLRDPLPHDSRPLVDSPYRRIDVGEYRIVYRQEADVIRVPLIGKRNDDEVYRDLRRLP